MPRLDHGMLCGVGALGQGGAWCRGFLGPLRGGCRLDTKRKGIWLPQINSVAANRGHKAKLLLVELVLIVMKGDGPANIQGI